MSIKANVPLSILDLSTIREGGTVRQALDESLDLAQHAEKWGYRRIWLAEHHGMRGIASAATSVVIGHVASGTSKIRVGSGGIMLPNHAPLVIAEQFGTLEALYPGRIDLGLGRAPGTDPLTARALRRHLGSNGDTFPDDLAELRQYFSNQDESKKVRAVPGEGQNVPIYILGSSDFGARLAANLGLPFAFASHFAPDMIFQALDIYRSEFQPSETLAKPYAMVGVNVIVAETDAEAKFLFTSPLQQFRNLIRGTPGQLRPPVEEIADWRPGEVEAVDRMLRFAVVGSSESVRKGLDRVMDLTDADELITVSAIYDHTARLRSFELLAELWRTRSAETQVLSAAGVD